MLIKSWITHVKVHIFSLRWSKCNFTTKMSSHWLYGRERTSLWYYNLRCVVSNSILLSIWDGAHVPGYYNLRCVVSNSILLSIWEGGARPYGIITYVGWSRIASYWVYGRGGTSLGYYNLRWVVSNSILNLTRQTLRINISITRQI